MLQNEIPHKNLFNMNYKTKFSVSVYLQILGKNKTKTTPSEALIGLVSTMTKPLANRLVGIRYTSHPKQLATGTVGRYRVTDPPYSQKQQHIIYISG